MKVHETRSHGNQPAEEERMVTRKQKAEAKGHEGQQSPKKAKAEHHDIDQHTGKSTSEIAAEFDKFCKATKEHLSKEQMREILEANGQDSSVSDDAVLPMCQDIMFHGPLSTCPVCGGSLMYNGRGYSCKGEFSEWSSCTYATKDPPRKDEPLKIPESVEKSPVAEVIKKHQDPKNRPKRELKLADKPFAGMMISLSGRLSRSHQYWRKQIQKHGGKVANHIIGVTCLVTSSAERERGGSSKLTEAMERSMPIVSEDWLIESINKNEAQPLDAFDIVSDLAVAGRGIPLDKQESSEEAIETIAAELKLYGKRGVHKDTKLQDEGAKIYEKDAILYNCAFTRCNLGRGWNDFCITQLIIMPDNKLHFYQKKGRIGEDARAEDKLEERDDIGNALKEFAKLFEEMTGNEFEPWEREKKFKKQHNKYFPIDMDDGVEVRHGGLGLRQLGVAAAHSKLDPMVASFMKVLCGQEIYRYALMELALDYAEFPVGMVTDVHLRRCEETLLEFVQKLKSSPSGPKADALWSDFSSRWFTLLPSTRPFRFRDLSDLAEHGAAAFETVRDITTASHIIGDMSGGTLDDPLFDRYKKLGCSISPVEKDTDDYKMIVGYLEKTYEPYKVEEVSYGVSVERIFAVELSASPSLEEIKKQPNKVLLWCGTRSSNLLRHLQKGFLPAVCSLPVPGYMFGKAIVCSDAAAEAARYGFTAVDRPEGFLVLAVASLGEEITEISGTPEDTKPLEQKKLGVKGLGKKKTDESEHFMWKGDIKVPCGRLVPSEHKDSPLEYNEYAVYDPKQVSIRFLVEVKYEEQNVEYDVEE
ncbi:OLC1v1004573C1 [Oldenlandia corymbosa var. corymbosa]|uniref:Poly [ADP-ribose] polymerase n=1 Tax=Oldenlandia corymbosa var. corymbosa TaxID=529605 RepID=A0AAV1DCN0_OLDCO|nr:OLC1v1004573C1 [Oldenlandia corymbosa var. corymbosa]